MNSNRNGRDWRWWLLPATVMVLLQGTGPCYVDDCSNPGESWCNGQLATSCNGAGESRAYWLGSQDCAAEGLTCVEGRAHGYRGDGTKKSWCLDLQACDTPGAYVCGTTGLEAQPTLMRCVQITDTTWYASEAVASLELPTGTSYVLEPLDEAGFGSTDAPVVSCQPCASTCGCPEGSACESGFCVPEEVLGIGEETLVCCGRERDTDCPKGAMCERKDGTEGTCQTLERCEACTQDRECESSQLRCLPTAPGASEVCLDPWEATPVLQQCDEATGKAWNVDVCGRKVASAEQVIVAYACKEGTDERWALNVCDQWVSLIEDCGEGYRCENNTCIPKVPEIEVSPTLLDFGNVAVGSTKTLQVCIGNIGTGPLSVSEVSVTGTAAAQFQVVQTQTQIPVDQILTIEVTFAPTAAGWSHSKLVVASDDADEPSLQVLMNGTGVE